MNLDEWKGEAARIALGDPTEFYDAFDAEYAKVMELAARAGTVGTAETFRTATRAGLAAAVTASIERAAPLIAEQVLREAAEAHASYDEDRYDYVGHEDRCDYGPPPPDFRIDCTDCGVQVGGEHKDGCDVARCLAYGTQRVQCGDGARLVCVGYYPWGSPIVEHQEDGHDCGRDIWTGRWPGVEECEEFGWWAVFVPYGNPSWKRVPAGTEGAVHDLNRLQIEAHWSAERRRWELP